MKKITFFIIALFGGFFSMHAQTISVQGKVTDQNSLPLFGVNVLVKDATRGTTTDFDGNYLINVNQGDVLVFSYIGFQPVEFQINEAQTLDVVLQEDASALEEVVVVGYGLRKKAEAELPKIEFEKIKVATNINVKFILKP